MRKLFLKIMSAIHVFDADVNIPSTAANIKTIRPQNNMHLPIQNRTRIHQKHGDPLNSIHLINAWNTAGLEYFKTGQNFLYFVYSQEVVANTKHHITVPMQV